MNRVRDKVVLITGATGDIGFTAARLMTEEGALVVLSGIRDDVGEQKAKEIGNGCIYIHLDVRIEEQWIGAMSLIEERFGRLNILVNNAGITGTSEGFGSLDPELSSLESWKAIQATNLDGIFLGCKHAIALMKKTGGSIVNISSRSALIGRSNRTAYCSSKAGVWNITKTVALYCAENKYDIRCNSVLPGMILTSMWDPVLGTGKKREDKIRHMAAKVPLGRFGKPEEVAWTILFLASDEASYITGTSVVVDGGFLAGGQ
jgi:NAD(P)-dependent dehydrogenase (short-subunit alcohol dehydrogenase family)